MKRQTRRTFLTTVGAAGTLSLAGCSALSDSDGQETTSKTTSQTGSPSTTSDNGKETTTQPSQGPQTFESFEKLGSWSAVDRQGKLKKSTKQKYEGSQSAHIVGSQQTKEGHIYRADFAQDGSPEDFSNKNLSLAFKCTSHDFVKIAVQLYAPDRGHIVEMKRTLYGPKGKWVRVNLGVTSAQRQQSVDLSKVYEMRIIGRPRDPNTSKPIEFYVDDMKTVPAPKKGMVMLTFDDGLESHFTKAHKMMNKYNFGGVDAIITDAVYDDGFLTQGQMRKMVESGWDMIAHPNTQAQSMNQRPAKEQEQLMMESKNWLKKYGYNGHKYMAVPKNVLGPNTFDLAQKHFDATLSFGAAPNAAPVIKKDTIVSRMYGDSSVQQTKKMIDYAAKYKQLSPFLFHKIGGQDGFPEKKFEQILKYIKQSNVEVVTLTDLAERNMLI
ncbi:polysaccharide deacetylase family protein [Haladaptatus caseinilyticus]|uniref:polysaccharide deacetylase family protein n=1 Tax=Haladaptatus caseinilyticus TaxID=2993314 RepID=UPI00224ADE63|nr:polysaccharide deacetylase family protein [Haladaptatus caseinilyticus]